MGGNCIRKMEYIGSSTIPTHWECKILVGYKMVTNTRSGLVQNDEEITKFARVDTRYESTYSENCSCNDRSFSVNRNQDKKVVRV